MRMIPKIAEKQKKEVIPKRYNQKVYNRIFLGGLLTFAALSVLAVTTNIIKNVSSTEKVQTVTVSPGDTTDYRLQNYLNNFVYYYFTVPSDYDKHSEFANKLSTYYVEGLQAVDSVSERKPSKLDSYRLVDMTESSATYLVKYTLEGDNATSVVTEFTIPYQKKDGQYYVSDFPYFTASPTSQVTEWTDKELFSLGENNLIDNEAYASLKEFMELFFTNYVSSQKNLDLISKGLVVLPQTKFLSITWGNVQEEDDTYVIQTQVSFESAGNTRLEHFTFEVVKTEDGYFVNKMSHGIKK